MAIKQKNVRVRIAPSPTGPLHIGTARTALINFLFARKHIGTFILRIEDTDKERSEKKWEKDISDGLVWLGLKWDEGPLRQSERGDLYKKYLKKLLDEKNAFYCTHTKEDLEKEQTEQAEQKKSPIHICADRDTYPETGAIMRFKNPGWEITFSDAVRGDITFDAGLLGDFSVARSTEEPLYNFAAVVDDYDMRISHVIRGEDHISNTPKQILLQKALGFPTPLYAHLPLALGTDRSKLSKRHGPVSLMEYKAKGYLPDAVFNFLALLGWRPEGEEEIFSREELISKFSFEDVQQSGAVFNIEKLNWVNGMYIRKLSLSDLTDLCIPYLVEEGLLKEDSIDRDMVAGIVALEQERLVVLSEIGERTRFFFEDTVKYDWELLLWKDMTKEALHASLETLKTVLESAPDGIFSDAQKLQDHIMPYAEKEGNKGILLWPLRALLSGRKASPGPFDILAILGKERSVARVEYALDLISS